MKKSMLLAAILLLLVPFMVSAMVVGLNDDVHFDYNAEANDFHIEGYIYSAGGVTPSIQNIIIFGDPGTGNWTVAYVNLVQVGPNIWHFTLHFKTDGYITYCQWIHFGIKFNVEAKNIIAKLKGWWTLNGVPLTMDGRSEELKQVAVTGFDVFGPTSDKRLKIMNDTNMAVDIRQFELAVSNQEIDLRDMFITGLGRPGEQSPKFPELVWKIVPQLPVVLQPGETIEIPLNQLGIILEPGHFLLMRGEQVQEGSKTRSKSSDWGWFWEQHGE